jgi:hypothetical protein
VLAPDRPHLPGPPAAAFAAAGSAPPVANLADSVAHRVALLG